MGLVQTIRAGRARRVMIAVAALTIAAGNAPLAAQAPAGPATWFSAWVGRFTDVGGFSDGDLAAFYRFDDANAFGGGIHRRMGPGAVGGVDVLYGTTSYERFERDTGLLEGNGDAKLGSALASLRLAGGGGILGIYLSAGAGVFAWDLDDEELDDGWDLDFSFQIAAGLEYAVLPRARLFAEYGQWWVYHQKDAAVEKNTANHNLLRVGARLGL